MITSVSTFILAFVLALVLTPCAMAGESVSGAVDEPTQYGARGQMFIG